MIKASYNRRFGRTWNATWPMILGATVLLCCLAIQAMAQGTGTAAGTAVTNQATVTYGAGSDSRTTTSNTTTFYVGHKVVINWSPNSSPNRTASTVDNVIRYYAFTVTNSGNRADSFLLATSNLSGAPSGTWAVQIVAGASDAAVTSSSTLAPGASFSGRLKVTIPANQTDGTVKNVTMSATSTAADDADSNIVVANPGESTTFTTQITVAKPVLAFTAVQNPANLTNAQRIPGQNITYTLMLQNTGTGAISDSSTMTFTLDPNFRFVSSGGGGTSSGANGAGNGGIVTWAIPADSMGVSSSSMTREVVVQIQQVTNNSTGPVAGTSMTAMTTGSGTRTWVAYPDGDNSYTQDNTNSFSLTVGTASGNVLAQVTANQGGNPGDTIEYQYTIKNIGNHSDTMNLTQAQNAGDLDVSHVFSLASGGSSITAAGIAQGVTTTVYVRMVIPTTATDGQMIIRRLTTTTATASPTAPTSGSTSSYDDVTTMTTAPQISVVLAGGASDIVSQPSGFTGATAVIPGSVVRYTVTITNAGTGSASDVNASNVGAHLTSNTIVASSVDIDADGDGSYELTGLGDGYNSGGISVSIDATTGFVTVVFNSVPSVEYRKYRYSVAVL